MHQIVSKESFVTSTQKSSKTLFGKRDSYYPSSLPLLTALKGLLQSACISISFLDISRQFTCFIIPPSKILTFSVNYLDSFFQQMLSRNIFSFLFFLYALALLFVDNLLLFTTVDFRSSHGGYAKSDT